MLTKSKTQNLLEFVQAPTGRVDRTAGVIRGVKILGRTSKNGREYSPQAMRQAATIYEGLGVNLNHPSKATPNVSRAVEDGIGWLENVTVKADGVYGDLAVLKSHPRAAAIFEFAERNPGRFGLSHNAAGEVVQRNGKAVVESVASVRSVDLVQNPATNTSLFESQDHMPNHRTMRSEREILVDIAKASRRLLESQPPVNGRHMALRYGVNRRGQMRTLQEADGELIKAEAAAVGLPSKPVESMSVEELEKYIAMLQEILSGKTTTAADPEPIEGKGWVSSPDDIKAPRDGITPSVLAARYR